MCGQPGPPGEYREHVRGIFPDSTPLLERGSHGIRDIPGLEETMPGMILFKVDDQVLDYYRYQKKMVEALEDVNRYQMWRRK